MLSKAMLDKLNEQIRREFYSAYLYLSMEAYFSEQNLNGFSNFFRVQAQEERDHAMMFFNYIVKVGEKVTLGQIDAPKSDFTSIDEVLEMSLKHEQFVTSSIYSIASLAAEEKDYKTSAFLQWFINEQAEEESTADNNLKRFKLVGNDGRGILMLDAEHATRVYMAPINPAL